MQNIVSDLVEHYNTLHSRVQVIFDENKAVAKYHLVSSTLPLVIHRNYLYAKLTGNPVRISRSERIDQPVCRLYDFQGLNIQERTPPSAYFGNSILT